MSLNELPKPSSYGPHSSEVIVPEMVPLMRCISRPVWDSNWLLNELRIFVDVYGNWSIIKISITVVPGAGDSIAALAIFLLPMFPKGRVLFCSRWLWSIRPSITLGGKLTAELGSPPLTMSRSPCWTKATLATVGPGTIIGRFEWRKVEFGMDDLIGDGELVESSGSCIRYGCWRVTWICWFGWEVECRNLLSLNTVIWNWEEYNYWSILTEWDMDMSTTDEDVSHKMRWFTCDAGIMRSRVNGSRIQWPRKYLVHSASGVIAKYYS